MSDGDLTLEQARGRLFFIVSALIGALAAGAILIGVVALKNQDHIEDIQNRVCLERHAATIIGNERSRLVNLVIKSEVTATRKGEKTLKGYRVPPEVAALERLPPSKPNPVPQCP